MGIEEVIYDLEYLISNNCTYTQIIDYVEEIELAIKALERQVPRKPIKNEKCSRYVTTYNCPYCDCLINGTGLSAYCWNCGQKLDWSDYDE